MRAALAETAYEAVWQLGTPFDGVEAAWQAPNRPQELRTYFLADGPRVVPRSGAAAWSLSARLETVARGGAAQRVGAAELAVDGRRVEYRRAELVEWYVNDERGLEQGFDLASRPLASEDAPLALVLALEGELGLGEVSERAVTLTSALEAGPLLSMSGLYAFDAEGRDLDARFERRGERLAIVVDDRDATYPITIDPTITNESAKLAVSGAPALEGFGTALDIDGTWALVGAPGVGFQAGAAYLFQQSGLSWSLQAKLVAPGLSAGDGFGSAVAVSATHAAISAPYADSAVEDSGRVFTYRNLGGTWSLGQVLAAPTPQASGHYGAAAVIGASYLAVGAPGHDTSEGAESGELFLFQISNGAWAPFTNYSPNLEPGDRYGSSIAFAEGRFAVGATGNGGQVVPLHYNAHGNYFFAGNELTVPGCRLFGASVAMEGNWLLIGDPTFDGSGESLGGAFMFQFDDYFFYDPAWNTFGFHDGDRLGASVALSRSLSGDHHALIGMPAEDLGAENAGAVLGFRLESGGNWTFTGYTRADSPGAGDRFGSAVAASGDVALVGAPFAAEVNGRPGAAFELLFDGVGWTQTEELGGVDVGAGDLLGSAVDVQGDLAVVGAPGESDTAADAGAVYVFERSNDDWRQTARLTSQADARQQGRFGAAVALEEGGQRVVVGAPGEDGAGALTGVTYVFERDGAQWIRTERISPWATTGVSHFGAALSLAGELLVIGAPLADGDGNTTGAAYVLRESGLGWSDEARLVGLADATADAFGAAVYTDGEQILVGAPGDDDGGAESGSVTVFERLQTTWVPAQALVGAAAGAELGRALAGEGGLLAVGAPGGASNEGEVLLYERDGHGDWSLVHALQASDHEYGDRFGAALDVDGGRVLVGAPLEDVIGQGSGAAYLYERVAGSWQERKLGASDASADDQLGASVALSGATALAGAPNQDEGAGDAGAAYAFEVEPTAGDDVVAYGAGDGSDADCPCDNESAPGSGEGCRNSTGSGGLLAASGSTSVSADDLVLHATQLLPNQPALLFAGINSFPGVHFGDGLRVAGGSVVRLQVAVPSASGAADFGPGLAAGAGFQGGDVRYLQAWYRDPNVSPCGSGFNLTNGLAVSFTD